MELSSLNTTFVDLLIRAIGNTIIHSLWQGVIIALFGGIILLLRSYTTARIRYTLLSGALILFTAITLLTFIHQFNVADNILGSTPKTTHTGNVIEETDYMQYATSSGFSAINNLTDYYIFLVLIWFFVICIKAVRMATGMHTIYKLKKTNIVPADAYWLQTMTALCKRIGVTRTISLVESGLAQVPMVIGHLKPVILMPIGLINRLPVQQVEAIIAHELAHIYRKDFLMNLLQSFTEIVLFYNPAVLWISSLIREERENCCDDIAVTITGNKLEYIQALVACEEYQELTPTWSMALTGDGGSLLNRVKRIIGTKKSSLNLIERLIITVCFVCTLLITAAFTITPPSRYTEAPTSINDQSKPIKGERVKGKEMVADLMNRKLIPNKNKFTIRITNKALYINDEKQSAKLHQYILNKYVQNPSDRLNYTQSVSIN
ncbi:MULTISPECIES: M56 family metallopeptidase [Sphingobacterium]|uniref:M56 family metallopeptidase n=1 Tax=Sphingobacterium TaxID=28453 RepID=UPI001044820C|nr:MULTISPECIES: M56 family metallopeptidase [Sphingobacterium]MCW2258579.1 beta-lactamase regulating signal transducer with metallopeptidase domain [Sphingobacterium kitahiroshimense]TCR14962.1 beta-lactamase regulating signal transducer with metallopeptidase domain [Sphingobacterium sp. JUb78]